jgi:hypothetical protein
LFLNLFIIREKIRKTNFPEVWPFLYKNSHNWAAIFLVTLLFILPLLGYAAEYVETKTTLFCYCYWPPSPLPKSNYLLCVCVRCTEGSERRSAPYDVPRGPAPHTSCTPSHPFPPLSPPPPPFSAGQPGGGGARGSAPLDTVQWTATALFL